MAPATSRTARRRGSKANATRQTPPCASNRSSFRFESFEPAGFRTELLQHLCLGQQFVLDRFRQVISLDPGSREAEQAANLILDSFTLLADWENLRDVSLAFHDQPGLGGAEFKRETLGIYENASLKLIEVTRARTGDNAQAGREAEAFYYAAPTSPNADLALNNAATWYAQAGRTEDAMRARKTLLEAFPKGRYAADQLALLGFDYESTGAFADAAVTYERLYALNPAHPSAPDAIYSAAIFRNALGEWEASVRDNEAWLKSYPDRPGASTLTLSVGTIYEEHGRLDAAFNLYGRLLSAPPDGVRHSELMFARLRYGMLLEKRGAAPAELAGWWKNTLDGYTKAQATDVDMGTSNEIAAQILFHLAEPALHDYLQLEIQGPGERQVSSAEASRLVTGQLVSKAAALRELESRYTAIIATGAGEQGVASLTRLGSAYEDMGETLLSSYVPPDLTEAQRELYLEILKDKAAPSTQKAAALYAAALDRAHALSLYDDSTMFAARRLGVLLPAEYPGLAEVIVYVPLAAPAVQLARFEVEP